MLNNSVRQLQLYIISLIKPIKDFAARAACHEIDHMDGILYIDKVINEEN